MKRHSKAHIITKKCGNKVQRSEAKEKEKNHKRNTVGLTKEIYIVMQQRNRLGTFSRKTRMNRTIFGDMHTHAQSTSRPAAFTGGFRGRLGTSFVSFST